MEKEKAVASASPECRKREHILNNLHTLVAYEVTFSEPNTLERRNALKRKKQDDNNKPGIEPPSPPHTSP
jgi:hypothetical protein